MTQQRKAEMFAALRVVEALVVIITAPVLLGLGAWTMATVSNHDKDIAVLKYEASKGERYTAEMAEINLEPIVERVNDHELRIRKLEVHGHE